MVSDAHVGPLPSLVDEIRLHGAGAAIQLTHAGAMTTTETIGQAPIAPSAVKSSFNGLIPVAMDVQQTDDVVEAFATCARRAADSGFDGVELHGAHGYLLNQFMSPVTNTRDGEYGDGPEGRLLFPLRVIRVVREAVGPKVVLMYRLGVDDGLPGGITPEDAVEIAPRLVDAGVDVIDVSGGLSGYQPFERKGEGFFADIGSRVRAACESPVIVTGGIESPVVAEAIVRKSAADLVGVGRAMLEDPNWARRARIALAMPPASEPLCGSSTEG